MRRLVLLVGAILMAGVRYASGQTTAGDAPAPHVVVQLRDAPEPIEGSLLTLSAESVTLLAHGERRTYPLDQVTRVERRGDGSWDGALRGAGVLGGLCAVSVYTCAQGARGGRRLVLANAALGALLGWWIDRAHEGRTTIYAPSSQDSRRRR